MSQTVSIVNPLAGSGRASLVWRALQDRDPRAGALRVIEADRPEVARRKMAAMVLEHRVDTLVAVGGDGTVHTVANFLLDHDLTERVRIAVLPAGTGSDLARTLGIPTRPEAAWARIVAGESQRIDALRLDSAEAHRWIVNVGSLGLSSVVGERVREIERRSQWVYLSQTLAAIRAYEPVVCRIAIDGEEWFSGAVLLVAVANGRAFGKGMKIAPRADLTDGLADVVVVEAISKAEQCLRLPQVVLGKHLGARPVRWRRARTVAVESIAPALPFELDGELFAADRADIEVVPGALQVIV